MLLRRITEHVKAQSWFAVALDFGIVVIGVFIGIQVSNWNEARTFYTQETELLSQLRREINAEVAKANEQRESIQQVLAAIRRSMRLMDRDVGEVPSGAQYCDEDCGAALADFFHASQWFPTSVSIPSYSEMRRLGLPRSTELVKVIENFLNQNQTTSEVLAELPEYRSHVRSLIPIAVHDVYWQECYELNNGIEKLRIDDCSLGLSPKASAKVIEAIVRHPETRPLLTFWYSEIRPTPDALADQNATAMRVISAIDAELGSR